MLLRAPHRGHTEFGTRRFYRVLTQRFNDVLLLLEMDRKTAAVYLAGYSIECMLKALILPAVPQAQEAVAEAMMAERLCRRKGARWQSKR
jgi:hypothetical protein